jgi:TDG/mug DNA glycosylase family protein
MTGDRIVAFKGSLPDIIPKSNGILLIGINPSTVSVRAGHYYQGRLGKRLWARLARLGLLDNADLGAEDEAFARAGNGLTDIVKRPTPSAKDLNEQELAQGAITLLEKIRSWKPGLILFSFREPAIRLIGKGVRPGRCGEIEGVPAFLLSGPYAPSSEADAIDQELLSLLRKKPTVVAAPIEKSLPSDNRDYGEKGLLGGSRTQRVTAVDLRAGRIRLPRETKRYFPAARGFVTIILRGTWLDAAYDPRTRPDRERSAVLSIGRERIQSLVKDDEILTVSRGPAGEVKID